MKHTRPISRVPMVAQSTVQDKIDFFVSLAAQATDLWALVLDVVALLYGLFLPWPPEGA